MAGIFGNIKLTPPDDIQVRKIRIGRIKALVLSPKEGAGKAPGLQEQDCSPVIFIQGRPGPQAV